MNARSALFDLYGDHLRERDGAAPIAALVRLMAPLGVAGPAVRTAVSRMARQGWLEPVRLPQGPGYALTPRAVHRLDDAARRVYREFGPWDGQWHVLVVGRVRERASRERLAAGLGYLGFGRLDDGTWVGPRASAEADRLLADEGVRVERFRSAYDGDARALVARVWDLDELAKSYEQWLGEARQLVTAAALSEHRSRGEGAEVEADADADAQVKADAGVEADGGKKRNDGRKGDDGRNKDYGRKGGGGENGDDERAFAVRSRLVHEWRKFLFRDPGLPAELLPAGWPGEAAAAYFDTESSRLLPAASRFIDRCLENPATA